MRLGLYDDRGRLRGALGVQHSGSTRLNFLDSQGRVRLRAGPEEGEMPELKLRDEVGHSRALLRNLEVHW